MTYQIPKNREEAERALDAGMLFAQVASGKWWVARRNGGTQTWKRSPMRYRIPIKMGLYVYHSITEINVLSFRIAMSQNEANARSQEEPSNEKAN